jgi:endonuclease I
MFKIHLVSLIQLGFVSSFIKPTIAYNCIIKNTLLYDNKMPSIYTYKTFKNDDIKKNNFLTAEHIFPQSLLLNKKESNDMHNIIKTLNTLNVNRSNYKYHDDINIKKYHDNRGKNTKNAKSCDIENCCNGRNCGNGCNNHIDIDINNWVELEYGNYVNHKDKLFVPNNDSKGFISRAILYMCREYDYSHKKVIDTELLKKWFYTYSPSFAEKYHNEVIKRLQNKNNIFISNYNKKNKGIKRMLDSL